MDREKLLQSPLPIDRIAARVVFKKGEHWTPKMKPATHIFLSPLPLPTRPFPFAVQPHIRALVGRRRDRLQLIGLALTQKGGPNNKQAWVVRCDCGNYEHREKPLRWLAKDAPDACRECRVRYYATKGIAFGFDPSRSSSTASGNAPEASSRINPERTP